MSKKDTRLKAKSWGIIIPCEWEGYMKIVHRAKEVAKKYYWIKHDSDYYESGEIKKEHVHLIMTFHNAIALNTMQNYFKEFGQLKENSYEKIINIHGSLRYLVHADNPEKYQYKIFEVETSDKTFANRFIEKRSSLEEIILLNEAFETPVGNLAFRDYAGRFTLLLENMNSYQKMIVMLNLRKEWRLLRSVKES